MKNNKNIIKNIKKEILTLLDNVNYNFATIHNKSALFYGMTKYKNKIIGVYYYYDLEERSIATINVVFKKINMIKTDYLFFRYKKQAFFNKKIKWKKLTLKTIFKRFIKYFYLFNNYKFITAYIDKEEFNIKNIDILYKNHLDELKRQFIAIECSKKYGLSYEWIIKNWKSFLQCKFTDESFLKTS